MNRVEGPRDVSDKHSYNFENLAVSIHELNIADIRWSLDGSEPGLYRVIPLLATANLKRTEYMGAIKWWLLGPF